MSEGTIDIDGNKVLNSDVHDELVDDNGDKPITNLPDDGNTEENTGDENTDENTDNNPKTPRCRYFKMNV